MRAFVAVGCEELEPAIEGLQAEIGRADGLDFVPPENVHVTLSFLGDVDPERLDRITGAIDAGVRDSGVEPFEVVFGGLGVFPSEEYIRVLWVGVREGGEYLRNVHRAIESRTAELGFEPDDREFTPHATIARLRDAGGKAQVKRALSRLDPTIGRRHVERMELIESTLTEDGPVYEPIERFPLKRW